MHGSSVRHDGKENGKGVTAGLVPHLGAAQSLHLRQSPHFSVSR